MINVSMAALQSHMLFELVMRLTVMYTEIKYFKLLNVLYKNNISYDCYTGTLEIVITNRIFS